MLEQLELFPESEVVQIIEPAEHSRLELVEVLRELNNDPSLDEYVTEDGRRKVIDRRSLSKEFGTRVQVAYERASARENLYMQVEEDSLRQELLDRLDDDLLVDLKDIAVNDLEKSVLREQARRDSLTGLYNRKALDEDLLDKVESYISGHERIGETQGRRWTDPDEFSIIYLDIDFFKMLNDTYGHSAGDIVLRQLAEQLTESVAGVLSEASQDHAYRIVKENKEGEAYRAGGEEFAVIFKGTQEEGLAKAREIQHRIRGIAIPETEKYITASMGIKHYPAKEFEEGTSQEHASQIMEIVDEAMYEAKNNGKDRIISGDHRQIPLSI
ncbi:GGDEF domain-containing protein [Nanoarchaeota archaeon]